MTQEERDLLQRVVATIREIIRNKPEHLPMTQPLIDLSRQADEIEKHLAGNN